MRFLWILIFLTAAAGCGPVREEPSSETKWLTGAGPSRGHEDLTRLGVDRANDALESRLGYRPYPSVAKGVAGVDTGNFMVKGNYESDFPSNKMYEFHDVSSSVDWHNDGRLQHIHSLRDYPDGTPLGLRLACESTRRNIIRAAQQALESFQAGQTEDGRYWLGHATHVIQDSFSHAHASRAGDGRHTIVDLCVYGTDAPGICKHEAVDMRDRIWKTSLACQTDPNNRGLSCMKSEAQDAVSATAAFLVNAGEAIFTGGVLDTSLQEYFDCESLAE